MQAISSPQPTMPSIVCLLVTHDCQVIGDPFSVRFVNGIHTTVCDVAEKVFDSSHDIPRHLRYLSFTLWKLNEAFPFDPPGPVPGYVKNLNLGSSDGDCNAEKMISARLVNRYFSPETLPPGCVHVVVQLPEEPYSATARSRRRHARQIIDTETDNLTEIKDFFRKSEYLRLSPSLLAQPMHCKKNQENEEQRILNDRPHKDIKITPIALLCQPFGRFLDRMHDSSLETDDIAIDSDELEIAVDDFAIEMSRHYSNESSRQKVALDLLKKIFARTKRIRYPEIRKGTVSGKRQSGGHAYGPADVLETVVEIENELGSGQ